MNAKQQQPTRFQSAIMHRLLPSRDYRLHVRISERLAIFGAEFFPSWDRRKWNPSTAISLKTLTKRVNVLDSHQLFSCNYIIFNSIIKWKDFQKFIGYADVKSTPVHFYVQRNSSFDTKFTPIPFELAVVNEGNAMDLSSGKFTAPRPGIYFFSFAGRAYLRSNNNAWLGSYLYLNGNLIGSSLVQEVIGTSVNQDSPLSLQSTLNLKTGDQLWVTIDYCCSSFIMYLYDDSSHYTHFTGFMLEEEIGASLWV